MWTRVHQQLPFGADWAAYLGLRLWSPVFLPVGPGEISPSRHITDIPQSVSIVFASGSADRLAPLDDVKTMCERVRSHARLVVFPGAQHVSLDWMNPELYRKTLFGLLEAETR